MRQNKIGSLSFPLMPWIIIVFITRHHETGGHESYSSHGKKTLKDLLRSHVLLSDWDSFDQRYLPLSRNLHQTESFQRASITWRGFRNIRPNNDELKKVIARNDWRFVIIMGKYDQVIRTRQAESFLKRINQLEALIEIECGHDFFRQENITLLSPHIKI